MRALIQRVCNASVSIDNEINGEIDRGILLLLGIGKEDNKEDFEYIIRKVSNLRIFQDDEGKMNNSLLDINGEILIIPQFTLFANTKKGNRPSFIQAAVPAIAKEKYNEFLNRFKSSCTNIKVQTGIFGTDMKVSLTNDGPVTIWLDSKEK